MNYLDEACLTHYIWQSLVLVGKILMYENDSNKSRDQLIRTVITIKLSVVIDCRSIILLEGQFFVYGRKK